MGIQVGQVLRQSALAAPDRIALVDLGDSGSARRELTYRELDVRAQRVAASLRASGVQVGDRVGLLAENSAACVVSWFGIVYAGAAVVPLHVLSSVPELEQRLQHSSCRALLHDEPRAELARAAGQGTGTPVVASLRDIEVGTAELAPEDLPPAAAAMVLYTSGTTGTPKGAVITHTSLLLHTSVLSQRVLGLDASAVVLCVLPLSHSYGCRMAMLAPFFAQARLVVLPRFDATRALAVLREEQVTWAPVVPTMLAAWAAAPAADGGGSPSLRWVLSAGAPLEEEIARRAEARLGVEVRQGYGMTEATFSAINAPPDERRFGCVGRPVWGIEVRIVDDAQRDVRVGETGEVLVRGHNVMSHYLDDPEASARARLDGFMHSGDIGRLDDAGRLYIVDRIKDMIIRGGYNVYPSEVEAALAQHPHVAQVAVVGRPDPYYGEEIVAVVVPAQPVTVEVLSRFASERLGRMRRPRDYVFCDELPLGPSGKVHKRTLREWIESGRLRLEAASADR